MDIEFDPAKNDRNVALRGLSFSLAREFDLTTALTRVDARHDYSEKRYASIGFIGERLYMLVFTLRPMGIRVISLQKANTWEVASYEQETRS
jgi:uncharacterized DUF497 family protein